MTGKQGARRKTIRYFRWSVKAAFLLFFVSPLIFLAGAPDHFVYSFSYGGLNEPLLTLPYGQSVCVVWTYAYGQIGPGAWLICPLGGLQALLTGYVDVAHILPTITALLLFLVPIFLLGNIFCSWVCPVGTIIDSFDKAVAKWMPKIEAKRVERAQQNRKKQEASSATKMDGSNSNRFVACPSCPVGKVLGNKHANLANGILAFSLIGSAILRFPVFCAICPIGITTRGMFNLKAWTSLTGKMMPIILELWAIPVIAVLASLREKRYWCRKICPVGATLNIAGSVSPFLKPTVKAERCIMKGCPKTCEDYHLDYCGACRQVDAKNCEKVCPQGINLVDGGSLARCTKCFECYIECEKGAVEVECVGKSEAYVALKQFLNRKRKKQPAKESS